MTSVLFALQEPSGYAGFESGWRSLAALVVVFGLLGFLAWLAKRGSLPGGLVRRTPTTMRVDSALALGERRSLAVVEVEGRRLLIGMSPASVSLIAELTTRPFDSSLQAAVTRRDGEER